jgi:hypothetical protein
MCLTFGDRMRDCIPAEDDVVIPRQSYDFFFDIPVLV